jgi:hypothetical protein
MVMHGDEGMWLGAWMGKGNGVEAKGELAVDVEGLGM